MKYPLLFVALTLTPCLAEMTWTGPNQPDDDTLVLYHMDESGSTLIDSGPQGLNAPLRDASALVQAAPEWMNTPSGGVLYPVGENAASTGMTQNVEIKGVDYDKGVTISFWYRPLEGETRGGELFQMENPRVRVVTDAYGPKNNGRLLLQAPGLQEGEKPPMVDFGPRNEWRHIAVVYEPIQGATEHGGTWTLFLDGNQVGSISDPTDYTSKNNFGLRVGGNVFNNGPLQGGQLDEFLITNRILKDFSTPATRP